MQTDLEYIVSLLRRDKKTSSALCVISHCDNIERDWSRGRAPRAATIHITIIQARVDSSDEVPLVDLVQYTYHCMLPSVLFTVLGFHLL